MEVMWVHGPLLMLLPRFMTNFPPVMVLLPCILIDLNPPHSIIFSQLIVLDELSKVQNDIDELSKSVGKMLGIFPLNIRTIIL